MKTNMERGDKKKDMIEVNLTNKMARVMNEIK